MTEKENIVSLNLDLLIPNRYQPRKVFNDNSLNELALSIKEYGVLNPILVRKQNDKYEIIAGERRVKASRIAGMTTIPAIIKNVEDNKMAEIALVENIERENITPIEEAKAYDEILKENNITENELSAIIGKSQSFISNKLRLLTLPIEVQDAVMNKQISEKHARTLLLNKNQKVQKDLLKRIIAEKMSVRELENIIKEKKEEKESDNMNNGNFFPNFNTTGTPNSGVTLNTMNMQATPGTPPAVEITPMTYNPQPMTNEAPQVLQTQVSESQQSVQEPTQEPLAANNMQSIIPTINPQPMDLPTQDNTQNNIEITTNPVNIQQPEIENINEIPLFAVQNNQPLPQENKMNQLIEQNNNNLSPTIMPEQSAEEEPVIEPEPLLFPENNSTMPPLQEDNQIKMKEEYSVPILTEDGNKELTSMHNDKDVNNYYKVKKFLEENAIPYKAYTNETNNCIIIEF